MSIETTASFLEGVTRAHSATTPCLIVGVRCAEPLASACLYALRDVEELNIGRGERPELRASSSSKALQLEIPDRWMSAGHAQLACKGSTWALVDRGSKNGSYVNGMPVQSRVLEDRDVIEVGSTFLVFRTGVPMALSGFLPDADERPETFCGPLYQTLDELARVAHSNVPVLLCGETGSGKEVMARRLHRLSARTGPFVGINCAAIADSIADSELFGHKKGAFSGANEDHSGLIRSAHGGTLLLDEIAELDARLQAKLLRVLQEREVLPVGGTRPIPVDVRIVCASSRELRTWVEAGHFRDDLFARLAGHEVNLPPLRERLEDLGLLLHTLLLRILGNEARRVALQREAVRALYAYSWPGNIRELEQVLSAAVNLAAGAPVSIDHLPKRLREPARTERDAHRQMTRDTLLAMLSRHRGNISSVARELGKERLQVRRWCKRFNVDPDGFRGGEE